MMCIAVEHRDGRVDVGSAFHIGTGHYVTARHVVDGTRVTDLQPYPHALKTVEVQHIVYPHDDRVDLAVLVTNHEADTYVEIGYHLDDWIGDSFVLSQALLMGYPPIPYSSRAELVATAGEINAVIDKYNMRHPHFIVSAVPRGGFSGGPLISEFGYLLGVLTESLIKDSAPEELGFASAISIEPLLNLLVSNNIRLPQIDDDIWQLFSNEVTIDETTSFDEDEW